MKRILALILITAPTIFSSFVTGPGPTMNENSFIIDGDNFQNQLVRLDIKTKDFTNNYYGKGTYNFYQDYENMTVKVSGRNNVLTNSPIGGIKIDFNKFKGVGLYNIDSSIYFSIYFKKDSPTEEYDYHYLLDEGEINITSYGQVGELIEGVFSGKFTKITFNKLTGSFSEVDTVVSIKDGKFSVVRSPDYHWDAPRSTGTEPGNFKKEKKKKQE